MDSAFDWCSASVLAIIYAISYYFGPCYNGTRLYYIYYMWCHLQKWNGGQILKWIVIHCFHLHEKVWETYGELTVCWMTTEPDFRVHNQEMCCSCVSKKNIRSFQKFAHDIIDKLLQHVQIWSLTGSLESWFTQWGRDKMVVIFQPTFSNVFSLMTIYEFWLIFHWSLFLMVWLTIRHHWFR